jgi:hypothetical protein
MSCICIIDTTIFLNILNVEGRNQKKDQVIQDYQTYVDSGATFILPMATIIETGNHIAQNGDGNRRRTVALRFCKSVQGAFNGQAPYAPSDFPDKNEVLTWLDLFPDLAGKNSKDDTKLEGTSFGDLSIIEEYKKAVRLNQRSEVFIWSLDRDLKQYHHQPNTP